MNKEIQQYIKSCNSCQKIKASQRLLGGLLQPRVILSYPWEQISIDFIMLLLITCEGFNVIVVFMDILLKMIHFILT